MIDRPAFESSVKDGEPAELLALSGELQGLAWLRLTPPQPKAADADRLLDMDAVAATLGVPVAHARELGRRGELPVVHVGRYVRVRAGALTEWMALRESGRLRTGRSA